MIAILGAGSVGCLLAAHLSRIGEVAFVSGRSPAPIKRFQFLPYTQDPEASPEQSCSIQTIRPEDLKDTKPVALLICTKSYDAPSAISDVVDYLPADVPMLLFQNGLGSQTWLCERYPDKRLYAAVTTEGANRSASGVIVHAGTGLTRIGALTEKAMQSEISSVVSKLNKAGLTAEYDEQIWQALWHKLVINCAINPFTALLDCPNGAVQSTPLFQEHWPDLKHELVQMLSLAGHPLAPETLEQRALAVMNATRDNISSMLQDVRSQRRTEIDDINGFAWQYLRDHGASGQSNYWLWEQVHALGH